MRTHFIASVVGLALVLVALVPLLAAASPLEFGHTWGTNATEYASGVVIDSGGNVIIAGVQTDPTTFVQHSFLAKFSPSGSLVWNRVFGSGQNASADIALASGGDVYVLGEQATTIINPGPNGTVNSTITSASVARISSSGSVVFYENLTEMLYGYRIATDPVTGGFVIVGRGLSTVDTVVAAFTSTGVLRWARDAPSGIADPISVAVDSTGRVFALVSRGGSNAAVDAFDNNGTLLGQVQIGSFYPNYVFPIDLVVTSSGPAVVGFSGNGVFLSQLTSTLASSWAENVQASGWYSYPNRVVALSDGSLALLANGYSTFNGTSAAHLYHLSSTGAAVSGSSYVGVAEAQGLSQGIGFDAGAPLANGGILLAGATLGVMPTTSTDVILSTSPFGLSWSTDSLSWSPMSVTVNAVNATLLNPTVPVDNWNELAGPQAWFGETNLPASKLTVTVKESQSSPSSPSASFSTTVSGGRKPYSYSWSFGDGTFGSGSASPSHTYPGTGQYLAQVTVTDTGGNIGYGSVVVTVTGPPSVLFIDQFPSGVVYTNTQVSFYAGAVDPDGGTIVSYMWSFGDGTVDVTSYSNDYHYYNSAGNYTLTLTVTDSDQGFSGSKSMNVTVVPRPDQPPIASFFWSPFNPTVGTFVSFYGYYSYDPDGYITNFLWSFGDGSTANNTGCCVGHAYSAAGNYTVSLTVTDNAGLTGTQNQTLTVMPDQPPIADFFWYPQVPSVNQSVFFNAGYYSYDPDGYIVSWDWTFGDGTSGGGGGNGTGNQTGNDTGQGPYPTHIYTTFGTFDVTLTVTDNAGLSTSVTKSIHVNAPPTAAFTTSEAVGKAGTPLTFNAGASSDPDGDPLNYSWSFGDGSTATGSVVSHVFAVPGQYLVTLSVSDPYTSAYAQAYVPVIVPKSPVAIMAWSPTHPVAGQTTVSFDGANSVDPDGAITQYIWEFGDGTVGKGKTTTHVYASAGTYTLELVVIDEDGMSSRDVQTITVVAPSKGTVTTASLQNPAVGATVTLTDHSAVALVLTTAADGSFSLGGLAPGTYGIEISLAGYVPYTGTVVWDGLHGDLGTFVLTPLPPGGALGFVTSPAGLLLIALAAAAGVGAAAVVHRRRNRGPGGLARP